jgi:hypothetical protein
MTTNLFVEYILSFELHKSISGVSKLRKLHAEINRIKLTREQLPCLLSGQIKVEIMPE